MIKTASVANVITFQNFIASGCFHPFRYKNIILPIQKNKVGPQFQNSKFSLKMGVLR